MRAVSRKIGKALAGIRQAVTESGLTPGMLDNYEDYLADLVEVGLLAVAPDTDPRRLSEQMTGIQIIRAVMDLGNEGQETCIKT